VCVCVYVWYAKKQKSVLECQKCTLQLRIAEIQPESLVCARQGFKQIQNPKMRTSLNQLLIKSSNGAPRSVCGEEDIGNKKVLATAKTS